MRHNKSPRKTVEGESMEASSFRTFEDLEVYQLAQEFRKSMYEVGRRLPDFEKFALASQIRRAAVSLTNNIAEGHGRYHFPDQLRFLLRARSSLEELINDLNICMDEHYLAGEEIEEHKKFGWRVHNIISGYGRYLRERKNSKDKLQETGTDYRVHEDADVVDEVTF